MKIKNPDGCTSYNIQDVLNKWKHDFSVMYNYDAEAGDVSQELLNQKAMKERNNSDFCEFLIHCDCNKSPPKRSSVKMLCAFLDNDVPMQFSYSVQSWCFLVCRLSWFSTQTSVVNFLYYLFCLCNVRRQYLLPGILGIYCFLTGVLSLPAIALPKGRICSLVNQVYTLFPLMSLPPFGLH